MIARLRWILLPCVVLGACASLPPKPAQLTRLEHLRRLGPCTSGAPQAVEAQRIAEQAWRDGEQQRARHWAEIGLLRCEQAGVDAEQRKDRAALEKASAELKRLSAERTRLAEAIEGADEKIMLYEELAVAEVSTKEKELELSDFSKRLDAERALGKAGLAVKLAETVDARRYAARQLELAELALKQGRTALKKSVFGLATRAASVAKNKAEAAYAAAHPLYLKHRRGAVLDKRAEQMQAAAAKLPLPMPPKVRTVGQSRQLVLSLTRLFAKRGKAPRRSALPLLGQVAKLLAAYPGCPVLVNGFTSSGVPRDRRYALSLDRARQVTNYLLTLGLPFSRFAVSGRGSEEPIGRRSSSKNERVDVILLFQ